MYGWRLRIGIRIPSVNITMEQGMWRMAIDNVSIHTSRMLAVGCGIKDLHEKNKS